MPQAHETLAPNLGVDGFGMTPEEAGRHVAAGRMIHPPLGVYRDHETFERYRAALYRWSEVYNAKGL